MLRSTRVQSVVVFNSSRCKLIGGYGTEHDGERHEIHLCEGCFFRGIASLKLERRTHNLLCENDEAVEKTILVWLLGVAACI